MIDTKGNPKEEVNFLKYSVINYIESIDKLYNFYTNNILKENTEELLKIIDEPWELTTFNKNDIRKSFEKSFNEKESILNSLFFFSISIVENTLNKIAFLANKKIEKRIDRKVKTQGKTIEKLKLFIENKLSFSVNSDEWNNILEYYDIRNCLIHGAGFEDIKKAAIYESKHGILFDTYHGVLIINEFFLEKSCSEIVVFFKLFLDEVEKKI